MSSKLGTQIGLVAKTATKETIYIKFLEIYVRKQITYIQKYTHTQKNTYTYDHIHTSILNSTNITQIEVMDAHQLVLL